MDRPLDHAPQVVHEVGREQHRLQGRFEGRRRVGLKQVLVDRTVEEGRDVEVDLDTRNFLHRLEALAVVGRIELDRRRRDGLQAFRQAGLVEDEFDAVGTVKHEFLADGLGRREQRVAVGVAHVVGRQEVHAGNDLLEQLGAVRADGAVHVVRDCGPGIRNRRAQCGVYSGADVRRSRSKVADDGAGVGAIAVGQGVGICQPTIRQRQRVGLGRLCRLQVRRRRQLRPWKPLRRVRRRHLRLGVKAGALEQRGQEFGKHKRSRELKRLYHMLPVLGKCHVKPFPHHDGRLAQWPHLRTEILVGFLAGHDFPSREQVKEAIPGVNKFPVVGDADDGVVEVGEAGEVEGHSPFLFLKVNTEEVGRVMTPTAVPLIRAPMKANNDE